MKNNPLNSINTAMKHLTSWKIACGLVVAFIGASSTQPAAAQVNPPFTQEQADRLTPGFARQCQAEISAAMSRAGQNGLPQASGLASLSTFVTQSREQAQQQYQYSKNSLGVARDDWWPPILNWFA